MPEVNERLSKSKVDYVNAEMERGNQYGAEWAADSAEYDELDAVAKISVEVLEQLNFAGALNEIEDALARYIDVNTGELCSALFGEKDQPEEVFIVGIIKGAQDYFESVKENL